VGVAHICTILSLSSEASQVRGRRRQIIQHLIITNTITYRSSVHMHVTIKLVGTPVDAQMDRVEVYGLM